MYSILYLGYKPGGSEGGYWETDHGRGVGYPNLFVYMFRFVLWGDRGLEDGWVYIGGWGVGVG